VDDYRDPKVQERNPEKIVQMRLGIIGYSGAQNNASVTAMVHFIDKETNQEVFQKKVTAKLRYDSGAMSAAARKLVRSTVDVIRDNW
jgi:hypothetical protein